MDSKNSYVGSILMFLNMFVLIVAMILLMIVGAYHLLFEEPERLPYKAVVYDRSNKAKLRGKDHTGGKGSWERLQRALSILEPG